MGGRFPLSLFEDVSRLSFAAVVSFGAAVLVAATFCIRAPAALAAGGAPRGGADAWYELLARRGEADGPAAAVGAVPIVSIMYLCQFNILSVHAKLANPTRRRLAVLVLSLIHISEPTRPY